MYIRDVIFWVCKLAWFTSGDVKDVIWKILDVKMNFPYVALSALSFNNPPYNIHTFHSPWQTSLAWSLSISPSQSLSNNLLPSIALAGSLAISLNLYHCILYPANWERERERARTKMSMRVMLMFPKHLLLLSTRKLLTQLLVKHLTLPLQQKKVVLTIRMMRMRMMTSI